MQVLHPHRHPGVPAPPTSGRLIRWAAFYDPFVRLMTLGRDRGIREMTLDLAGLGPGERVLDVGCGTGDLTLAAGRRIGPSGRVYGIDAAPEMIAVARRKAARARAKVEFRVEAVEALSFPAGSFDVVLSSLMIHHLPGDLKGRALVEIRRVLRPGGRLLIVDFAAPSGAHAAGGHRPLGHRLHHTLAAHRPAPTTAAAAAPQHLPALLQDAGFTQVESGPTRFRMLDYARAGVAG